jgi:hypothetical protein
MAASFAGDGLLGSGGVKCCGPDGDVLCTEGAFAIGSRLR